MKRFLIIGGILVVIIIAIFIIKGGSSNKATEVIVEKAELRNITETVSANGKVQPEVQVKISSDVSGEIVELRIKEGDTVQKGDLLLRINPVIYESAVQRMQATLNNSRANLSNSKARLEQVKAQFAATDAAYKRNKRLFDQGAISAAEYETSKAQYEAAQADIKATEEAVNGSQYTVSSTEASLKEASDNLAKTSIYAPVGGTISKLNVEKGERVVGTSQMAGTELLIIANLSEMEVQVDVNENDILQVKLNDTAEVDVDAHSGRKFKGIVTEVANSANSSGLSTDQVTNFPVKIRILRESYADMLDPKNPGQHPFRPGMSATVEIMTLSVRNVVSVPIGAVTTRTDTAEGKSKKKQEEKAPDDGPNPELTVSSTTQNQAKNSGKEKPIECVFVFNNGTVKLVPVKTGARDNVNIEIVSGLKAGDMVVTGPYTAVFSELYNNAKVTQSSKAQIFSGKSK